MFLGKSNAFAISKKLGLSENLITRAKSLLSEDTINIEELLKNIYDDKVLIEKEKEKILEDSEKIEKLKASLQNEKDDISSKKTEIISKAKSEAKDILLDAKEDAKNILKEMENSKDSKKINNLRNTLNEKLNSYSEVEESEEIQEPISKDKAIIGQNVFIPSLNKYGCIISNVNSSNKVMVQIGNMKASFEIGKLVLSENNEKSSKVQDAKVKNNLSETSYKNRSEYSPRNVLTEINVIGYNVEEAIYVIDKFLDNAALSKLEFVRIVHGKGTGILGKGIQKYLKNHPHVLSYRYGTFVEGEMGVTVVEIKR